MSHTKKTKEHKANQQWTEKMLMLLLAGTDQRNHQFRQTGCTGGVHY